MPPKKHPKPCPSAFNRVLTNSGFYTAERFAGITIPAETLKLASDKPAGEGLARLKPGAYRSGPIQIPLLLAAPIFLSRPIRFPKAAAGVVAFLWAGLDFS